MNEPGRLTPAPRLLSRGGRGPWKRRLWTIFAVVFAVVWLLILPLPGPMARARHRWLTTGSETPGTAPGNSLQTSPGGRWEDASGTITSSGPSGSWKMQVTGCSSGQLRAFYGVALWDRSDTSLNVRVVQPESGPEHVTVSSSGHGPERVFHRNGCSLWDVDLHLDGSVVNSIYELAGHARFVCRTGDAELRGDVALRSCSY